jgi:hypothetical protein
VVDVDGRRAAVSAMFHPTTQPRIDDPGETPAPQALRDIFGSVAHAFSRLHARR